MKTKTISQWWRELDKRYRKDREYVPGMSGKSKVERLARRSWLPPLGISYAVRLGMMKSQLASETKSFPARPDGGKVEGEVVLMERWFLDMAVNCTKCGCSMHHLDKFPGGICIACHAKKFDAQVRKDGGRLPKPNFKDVVAPIQVIGTAIARAGFPARPIVTSPALRACRADAVVSTFKSVSMSVVG